jgi:hypothetical protein
MKRWARFRSKIVGETPAVCLFACSLVDPLVDPLVDSLFVLGFSLFLLLS